VVISIILGFKESIKLAQGLLRIRFVRVVTKGISTRLLRVPIIAVKNTKNGKIASISKNDRYPACSIPS
ncbi:hypothetical protein MHYMCMPASI_00967, partial [Hyalomma marginatum]